MDSSQPVSNTGSSHPVFSPPHSGGLFIRKAMRIPRFRRQEDKIYLAILGLMILAMVIPAGLLYLSKA
jgi:hypothetical protein